MVVVSKLQLKIESIQKLLAEILNGLVPNDGEQLTRAIRYSILNTGKRLRPLLIIETARIFNVENDDVVLVAAAIEMIHTYSLIHDDLPAMDNDDYRRGELTCHRKFNEYDAILAGDSLIPLAFETILAKTKQLTFEKKCKIMLIISKAIGYKGMCLGQSLDLAFEKTGGLKSQNEAELINTYKTGYLFKACVEIGCILGRATEEEGRALIDYSLNFGKAFQLMDDLDDGEIEEKSVDTAKKKIQYLVDECRKNLSLIKNRNDDAIKTLELIAEFCLG